ncbi:hypothetical protein FBZ89_104385 [Nitrospirillum amazonense]|uniref:HK97 gp10 family phage protein n=1 Tax=Nitrospirillum amazonense TaxID=28077 RepID=A0A560FKK1_9PROT|nr:HK97 gp10 family phage protein [Nitrospirillum amazonense]TWB22135.1 hypothetical protein FBZ89_104385 [Nitrospirillum amazonense]
MSFDADIAKWVAKAKGNIDKAVREVAVEVATRVVERTPVDTGAARGNWRADARGFTVRPTGRLDPDGADTIAHITEAVGGMKAGDLIYITNSSAYILDLEHGSSKQAPSGMVSVTVQEFAAIAQQAAQKVAK